jgi:RNA polymerase sigma-70 factor (ECF subfamily)
LTVRGPDFDDDLVVRAGRGDPAAIRSLVTLKLPRVLSLARRMLGDALEAEDVAQETFLKAWKFAPRWRPGQARFDTWLHRVALSLCYDRLRRRIRTTHDFPDRADPGPGPDRDLQARQVGRRVDAALQALAPRQREAIVLCHYEELSNIDAAAVMGVSVEALESLLSRARRALRTSLADVAADD